MTVDGLLDVGRLIRAERLFSCANVTLRVLEEVKLVILNFLRVRWMLKGGKKFSTDTCNSMFLQF